MPKYYEISEAAAKRAKDMNSYSDYAPGSATAGYSGLQRRSRLRRLSAVK